jgi:hypothetical protein
MYFNSTCHSSAQMKPWPNATDDYKRGVGKIREYGLQ